MTEPPPGTSDAAKDPPTVPELARWACEHGATQWEWETERRRSLDAKAVQIIGAVSAVLLWSISEVGKLPQPGWLQVFMAMSFVTQVIAGGLGAGFAFWCVRLTTVPYPNIAEIKERSHAGAPLSELQSLVHYRKHLEAALGRAREVGEQKARSIRAAEVAAIIAIPAGVSFAVISKIAAAS